MMKNKNLGGSRLPEQADEARNKAQTEHLAAFARRLGVNRSTVTRAAQAGRLSLTPEGLVLIEPSLQRWHASRGGRDDVAARHAEARGQGIPLPGAESAPGSPVAGLVAGATAPETDGASRAQHQAVALHWQNELLRLQLQIEAGQQLPREALLAELQGLGATLRGAVERLVDQVAPRLAVATDPAERRRLLLRELRSVRHQVRHEFPRALRRLVQTTRSSSPEAIAP
jgi:transcriptional regulator with XRE-family HTH domain